MTHTIQQWAADAAGPVQDACNMSGLVFALNECVTDLVAHGLGDGEIDRHPICVAWADKLDDLARCRGLESIQSDEPLTKLVPEFAEAMRSLCKEGFDTAPKGMPNRGTTIRNRAPSPSATGTMSPVTTGTSSMKSMILLVVSPRSSKS